MWVQRKSTGNLGVGEPGLGINEEVDDTEGRPESELL